MTTVEHTIAELAALAAQTSDQSQDTSTTFEYELPPEGQTGMRFIEYIELGFQPQKPYMGKPKPPALETLCTFELLSPKYVKEIDVEGGGKKLVSDIITERVTVKLSDKANFRKLLTKMTYGRPDLKHIAQMLGDAFKGTITHSPATNDKGEKIKQYANLRDAEGGIGISAPFLLVPVIGEDGEPTGETEKRALKVRESLRPLKIFLFDNPTKATWDSLFIDGTREVKAADGTVTQQSKNWIQERILSSTKYPGSTLEAMLSDLGGLSIAAGVSPAEQPEAAGEDIPDDAPPKATAAPPPAAKAAPKAPPPAKASATDAATAALAALGLEAA